MVALAGASGCDGWWSPLLALRVGMGADVVCLCLWGYAYWGIAKRWYATAPDVSPGKRQKTSAQSRRDDRWIRTNACRPSGTLGGRVARRPWTCVHGCYMSCLRHSKTQLQNLRCGLEQVLGSLAGAAGWDGV